MNQAVILCGGEGSRLFPMTSWTPKPLLPVRGVPIVVHIVNKLVSEGWDDIVVCIAEEARDQFEYHFDRRPQGMGRTYSVTISSRPGPAPGTAGELALAARFIKEDCFLVHYGDILTKMNTQAMRDAYSLMDPKPLALLGVCSALRTDKGIIAIAPDSDRVTALLEKPALNILNSVGVNILNRDILTVLNVGEDLHRDTLPRCIQAGANVRAFIHAEEFLDIGSVEAYRRAQSW